MKKWISLSISFLVFVPHLSFAQTATPNVKGVICDVNPKTKETRECTTDELKLMIDALKKAKSEGESAQKASHSEAHKIAKGMVIVGGTWLVSSTAMFYANAFTTWEVPTLIAESDTAALTLQLLYIGGMTVAPVMAMVGGVIMTFAPQQVADDTLSTHFTKDENFGKMLSADDDAILYWVQQNPALGQKIVVVTAALVAQSK